MFPFEHPSLGTMFEISPRLVRSRALKHDPSRTEGLQGRMSDYVDTVRAALGVMPALKVKVVDAAEAAEHETAWLDLATRALEPNIFFEPAFALAAAQHLSEAGQPSFVFVFETRSNAPERLLGVFPFTRSRLDLGAPMLRIWQHAYNPIGVPLIDASMAEATIEALFDHMEETPCLTLRLPNLSEDGPVMRALRSVVARRSGQMIVLRRQIRAVLTSGPHPDDYLETHWRSKKLKELRRLRRKLEAFGPVAFRTAKTPSEANEALERFFALEASGWKGRSGTALIQDAGRATFVRSMLRDLSLSGKIRVDGLYAGDALVAGAISLVSGGTVAFWKIAYDETFARYSPGVLLTQDLTRAFLGDASIEKVDSCAMQDHPMIDHLWHERFSIVDCLVSVSMKPRLVFHLAAMRETARLALKNHAKRAVEWVRRQRQGGSR